MIKFTPICEYLIVFTSVQFIQVDDLLDRSSKVTRKTLVPIHNSRFT